MLWEGFPGTLIFLRVGFRAALVVIPVAVVVWPHYGAWGPCGARDRTKDVPGTVPGLVPGPEKHFLTGGKELSREGWRYKHKLYSGWLIPA